MLHAGHATLFRFAGAGSSSFSASRILRRLFSHGGATSDFLLGRSIVFIQHRGRWASVKSAQHYIQMGRSLLVSSTAVIPAWSLSLADAVAADVLVSFAL